MKITSLLNRVYDITPTGYWEDRPYGYLRRFIIRATEVPVCLLLLDERDKYYDH